VKILSKECHIIMILAEEKLKLSKFKRHIRDNK